ncbi:Beta-3 adrenergic receptor [Lamellibrachia satsuma]|nr:Beta-3 adrenergic receptor [Lamellibrachia satsuma]
MAAVEAVFGTVTLLVTLASLAFITTTVNVTVMACVATEKKLHTTPGMYMFSLAVADGLVGLLVMPAMTVYTMYGLWPLGQMLCTLWVCTDFACCTVSTLHVLLFAHDRFLALYRPIEYRATCMKLSYALKRIALAWVVGAGVWLPAVLYYRSAAPAVDNDCYYIPPPLYVLVQSIVVYHVPLLLIVVIYVVCVNRLRKRFRTIADSHQLETAATAATTGGPVDATIDSTVSTTGGPSVDRIHAIALDRQRQRRRRHIRSLRTLGAVIAFFVLCWLPFCLFWPISAYCADCISANLYQYSYWSAYLNSTINPLLYFAFQNDFRVAFTTLRGRTCGCC